MIWLYILCDQWYGFSLNPLLVHWFVWKPTYVLQSNHENEWVSVDDDDDDEDDDETSTNHGFVLCDAYYCHHTYRPVRFHGLFELPEYMPVTHALYGWLATHVHSESVCASIERETWSTRVTFPASRIPLCGPCNQLW